MRITIFARVNVALNPYILLFKKTLEHQGFDVSIEKELNIKWILRKSKRCDCIHLHWINAAYTISKNKLRFSIINKLMERRICKVFFYCIRLMVFTLCLIFLKTVRKTIVYTVHDLGFYDKKSQILLLLNWLAHQVVFFFSDQVHVHNRFSRILIEAEYKRKNRIRVIPHGNYIGYYSNNISRSDARRQLGLAADAFIYLYLGLLRPYKGLEDLFEAFKEIGLQSDRLLVAGLVYDRDYELKLRSLSENDLATKLIPEFIEDDAMQLYLNACDIFVLPYKLITTSGAAFLALSFGRPIIAPAIASFPELITAETGILYDPSQPNALAGALRRARSQHWSETKIFEYIAQFDWHRLGPRFASLYRKEGA
jgi:glycosyltransferase involved in cell wall biosynthesis